MTLKIDDAVIQDFLLTLKFNTGRDFNNYFFSKMMAYKEYMKIISRIYQSLWSQAKTTQIERGHRSNLSTAEDDVLISIHSFSKKQHSEFKDSI